jgi:hypothetical protein
MVMAYPGLRGAVALGLILLVAAAAGGRLTWAAQAALPADLATAVADYDRAQLKGDRALLNSLLADDYHLINGGGEVESKAQFVTESSDPRSDSSLSSSRIPCKRSGATARCWRARFA